MSASLFLPHWLVDRMTVDDQAYAEELVAYQASQVRDWSVPCPPLEAQWLEHDTGVWEVRVG